MNQELEKYIDLAVADGVVTEKEKNVLIRKAKELGVDQDELEMVLEAKFHLQKKYVDKSKNETPISATKECPSCGAQNDVIFTNCMFCKTALPNVDINAISNDDLVMNASEWVGKIDGINKFRGVRISLDVSTGINKLFGESNYKYISYSKVIGFAEKYLNILSLRATNNDSLNLIYNNLLEKYNLFVRRAKKKYRLITILLSVGCLTPIILWFAIIIFSFASLSTNSISDEKIKNNEFQRLNNIELKIEDAVNSKDYYQALILVEKLQWKIDLGYNPNKELAKQYDTKRAGYKKTISEMIERSRNGNN